MSDDLANRRAAIAAALPGYLRAHTPAARLQALQDDLRELQAAATPELSGRVQAVRERVTDLQDKLVSGAWSTAPRKNQLGIAHAERDVANLHALGRELAVSKKQRDRALQGGKLDDHDKAQIRKAYQARAAAGDKYGAIKDLANRWECHRDTISDIVNPKRAGKRNTV